MKTQGRAGLVVVMAMAWGCGSSSAPGPAPADRARTGNTVVAATATAAGTEPLPGAFDPARRAADEAQAHEELAAAVQHQVEVYRHFYGDDVPLRVESGLFVFVSTERGTPFDAAADFGQKALDIYLGSFFARRPDRPVVVELVHSAAAFAQSCNGRFESGCERDLGGYSRSTRSILVNVGPGLPTIAHELIHPLVQTDFPRAPAWFEEGLAALFEKPVFSPPGEIHGASNWRYESIALALASPATRAKVSLRDLFALDDFHLDDADEDLHYAVSRALCQWLDERGQLWPFYRAWRDGVSRDPTGESSFAKVTGMTVAQAQEPWLAWAKALKW